MNKVVKTIASTTLAFGTLLGVSSGITSTRYCSCGNAN